MNVIFHKRIIHAWLLTKSWSIVLPFVTQIIFKLALAFLIPHTLKWINCVLDIEVVAPEIRISKNFNWLGSCNWVHIKHPSNYSDLILIQFFWNVIDSFLYSSNQFSISVSWKRKVACQHSIVDHTTTPNINWSTLIFFLPYYFRRHVVSSSTK